MAASSLDMDPDSNHTRLLSLLDDDTDTFPYDISISNLPLANPRILQSIAADGDSANPQAMVISSRTRELQPIPLVMIPTLHSYQQDLYLPIPIPPLTRQAAFHHTFEFQCIRHVVYWYALFLVVKQRSVPIALRLPFRRTHEEWQQTAREEIVEVALVTRSIEGPFWQPEYGKFITIIILAYLLIRFIFFSQR
jgi:hypothetical protein